MTLFRIPYILSGNLGYRFMVESRGGVVVISRGGGCNASLKALPANGLKGRSDLTASRRPSPLLAIHCSSPGPVPPATTAWLLMYVRYINIHLSIHIFTGEHVLIPLPLKLSHCFTLEPAHTQRQVSSGGFPSKTTLYQF
jgi:hypothetical protein